MRRYIEFLRWQVRIWFVRFGERNHLRLMAFEQRSFWRGDPDRFARFVDRLSPWVFAKGYKRVGLRRALYHVRYPRWFIQLYWLQLLAHWYQPVLGRYEGYADPGESLKAEWLDMHKEYASEETGDTDMFQWAALFTDLEVPWSLKPETWLLAVDSRGFVDATNEDAAKLFDGINALASMNDEGDEPTYGDEYGEQDLVPSWFPEGDPTRNGALG